MGVKFNSSWLALKDNNGHLISTYITVCESNETTKLQCKVCGVFVDYSVKGITAIRQHSDGKKHKSNYDVKEGGNQQKILLQASSTLLNPSFTQNVTKGELLYTMNLINKNNSFNSSTKDGDLFKDMFPDSEIAKKFQMNPKKVAYLTTEALGPHYRDKFLDEIIKNKTLFSILFDETSNVQTKNELQIGLRCWYQGRIITRHLETFFIDNGKADTIVKNILSSLANANLPLEHVLMIGADGPNVNKAVLRKLDEEVLKIRNKPLINIGSCSLHIVHNAFEKALKNIGDDASDLIIKIFYWFKRSALRCSDFRKIQDDLKLPKHKFIKHVKSRWLTAGPAAERLIEQISGVKKYFEEYLPKIDKKIHSNNLYKEIISLLRNKVIILELNFLVESATTFCQFTKHFQSEHPLIQNLYDSLEKLIYVLFSKSLKSESLDNFNLLNCDICDLPSSKNKLSLESLTASFLQATKAGDLTTLIKNKFLLDCQDHYTSAAIYIFKKIKPYMNLLEKFKFISPEYIKNKNAIEAFQHLIKLIPTSTLKSTNIINELSILQLNYPTIYEAGDSVNIELFYLKVCCNYILKKKTI